MMRSSLPLHYFHILFSHSLGSPLQSGNER